VSVPWRIHVPLGPFLTLHVVLYTLLPIVGNSGYSGNNIVSGIVKILAAKLPAGWQASPAGVPRGSGTASCPFAVLLKIRGPGIPARVVRILTKNRLEPREVDYLATTLNPTPDQPVLIAAPFLSPRTQERLKISGFAYADLTGNVRLSISEPGLFIETTGVSENPEPLPRNRKSLKGPKAGRIVRALCDFRPPTGVRELARRAKVDAGYASRVVDYLNCEALVSRVRRGPVKTVDWTALLRRWSEEYSPYQRQRVLMCLAPRGLAAVVDRLKDLSGRFAVSGSWAAAQLAPVAPLRLLLVYMDESAAALEHLEISPTDSGANVAVASPFDPVVYERMSTRNGVNIVAPSQVVVDLLTSPGRGPNEAEALMEWMQENEDVWRA